MTDYTNDKLLAEFLGYKYIPFNLFDTTDSINGWYKKDDNSFLCKSHNELNFNSDWNKLMLVVDAIENIDLSDYHYKWLDYDGVTINNNFNGVTVDIEGNSCYIGVELDLDPYSMISKGEGNNKKEVVYDACVKFVKWFNSIKEKNHDLDA